MGRGSYPPGHKPATICTHCGWSSRERRRPICPGMCPSCKRPLVVEAPKVVAAPTRAPHGERDPSWDARTEDLLAAARRDAQR